MPLTLIRQSASTLTRREAEILNLAHMQARDIAAELGISPRTVEAHFQNVYIKLGVENRTAAALAWRERRAA